MMLNVTVTSDPEVHKGIFRFMREQHGMVADCDDSAREILQCYLEQFIEEYGLEQGSEDGLFRPTVLN